MCFLFGVVLVNTAAALRASPIDDYACYVEATISFHVNPFGANRIVVGKESTSPLLSSRGKALHNDALGKRVIATVEPPAWTLLLERDTSAFSDKYLEASLMYNATASNTTYHVVRQESPNCIYTGTVHTDATSPAIGQAVISTCGDLWGAITANGTLFNLQYAEEFDRHVLLNSSDRLVINPAIDNLTMDMQEIPLEEGENVTKSAALTASALDARRILSDPALKRAAILVVNDNARYAQLGNDAPGNSVAIWSYVQAMYTGLYDPGYFDFDVSVQLIGQVTFIQTDPYVLVTDSAGKVNVRDVIKEFRLWLENERSTLEDALGEHIDDAQLLSGYNFQGTTAGLGFLNGVCDEKYAIAVNQAPAGQLAEKTATIVAHELGHNLGMPHDSGGHDIMAPKFPANPTNQFSRASKEAANSLINSKQCLDDTPNEIFRYDADCDVGVFIVERKYQKDKCDLIVLPNGGAQYTATGLEDFFTRAGDLYGRYGSYKFGTIVDEIDREAYVKKKNGNGFTIIKGAGINGRIEYKFHSPDIAETFAAFLNAFLPYVQIAGPDAALCGNLPY